MSLAAECPLLQTATKSKGSMWSCGPGAFRRETVANETSEGRGTKRAFCGDPSVPGGSWCKEHRERVFSRAMVRSRKAPTDWGRADGPSPIVNHLATQMYRKVAGLSQPAWL